MATRRAADEPAEPRFEASLASLEALVAKLESGELELEQALAAFEEGAAGPTERDFDPEGGEGE